VKKFQKHLVKVRDIIMVVILFFATFIYSIKIVLELNLSIAITTNSIECLHLCALLTALGMILVSIGLKEYHMEISFTERVDYIDLSQL